jgi:hypothetical protein
MLAQIIFLLACDGEPGTLPLGRLNLMTFFRAPRRANESHAGHRATLGGGFADISDRNGRLVERYVAIEHSDSSWHLAQYLRRPGPSESSHEKQSAEPAD